MNCNHKWATYQGFTDTFEYCTGVCGAKRGEEKAYIGKISIIERIVLGANKEIKNNKYWNCLLLTFDDYNSLLKELNINAVYKNFVDPTSGLVVNTSMGPVNVYGHVAGKPNDLLWYS